MTIDQALKMLTTGDKVAMAWLAKFVTQHPKLVEQLLTSHEVSYTGPNEDSLNKIIMLSGVRGRYFTEDLQNAASQTSAPANAKLIDTIKNIFHTVAAAASTVAPAIVSGLAMSEGADPSSAGAAGHAAQQLLSGIGNVFQPKSSGTGATGGASATPAPNITTSPEAQQIATHFDNVAKGSDDENKPAQTFWQQYKVIVIISISAILIAIAIFVYLKTKKKTKESKKD